MFIWVTYSIVGSVFVDGLGTTTAARGFGDGRPPGCLDCSLADDVVSSLVVLVSGTCYKQLFLSTIIYWFSWVILYCYNGPQSSQRNVWDTGAVFFTGRMPSLTSKSQCLGIEGMKMHEHCRTRC